MTADTKAVLRWNSWGGERDIQESDDGQFVLFKDHERVVGELREAFELAMTNLVTRNKEVNQLNIALAASRAEVEGLNKDAERYRWLRNPDQDVGLVLDKVVGETPLDEQGFGGYKHYEYRAGEELDTAIDAAMEKGNV